MKFGIQTVKVYWMFLELITQLREKAMASHSGTLAWKNPMDGGAWWAAVHGFAELDTIERLHFHSSLSCIGEGNGNPLQCSCLENPRDRGAWWAAVCGVAQIRTRLKRRSGSSNQLAPLNGAY